jgi:hypothetical protein
LGAVALSARVTRVQLAWCRSRRMLPNHAL